MLVVFDMIPWRKSVMGGRRGEDDNFSLRLTACREAELTAAQKKHEQTQKFNPYWPLVPIFQILNGMYKRGDVRDNAARPVEGTLSTGGQPGAIPGKANSCLTGLNGHKSSKRGTQYKPQAMSTLYKFFGWMIRLS